MLAGAVAVCAAWAMPALSADQMIRVGTLKLIHAITPYFYEKFTPAGYKIEVVPYETPTDGKNAVVTRSVDFGTYGLAAATLVGEIRFGVFAAVIAGFGRVVAEIGVAMMLGGNIRGYTRTMTTAIALETSKGEFSFGMALGIVLMAVALFVNLFLNAAQAMKQGGTIQVRARLAGDDGTEKPWDGQSFSWKAVWK